MKTYAYFLCCTIYCTLKPSSPRAILTTPHVRWSQLAISTAGKEEPLVPGTNRAYRVTHLVGLKPPVDLVPTDLAADWRSLYKDRLKSMHQVL